jgi:hypothetical protein
MKFTIHSDPKEHPNIVGELLRNEFFNQYNGKLGCYSTFDVNTDVKDLPRETVFGVDDDEIMYNVFEKTVDGQRVVMKYYWDGDGTLEFHFEDGNFISNDDCKKDYVWEYYGAE